jgi:hypothetical protein
MLESLNTELNEKNSALESRVLQLERQVKPARCLVQRIGTVCRCRKPNLTTPAFGKVSILLGDREQHMLSILSSFKATNEQVFQFSVWCCLIPARQAENWQNRLP